MTAASSARPARVGTGDDRFIDVRGVSKTYGGAPGGRAALASVELQCARGEFVTIVGASGCGKTTLLNIVGGLVTPSGGQVSVDGKPVRGPDPQRGMIFQQYALFPWLTARQNVEFGLRVQGVRAAERRRIALHHLDQVGLASFADALPKELSGGMKQRCAIARAYAVKPAVLLMDEPFGAIDAFSRAQLQEELLRVWEHEARTILFITHDVEEAVFLSNRVVVMDAQQGIRSIVPIDLPYPRTEAIRLSDDFAHLRATIWRGVHGRERGGPSRDHDGGTR